MVSPRCTFLSVCCKLCNDQCISKSIKIDIAQRHGQGSGMTCLCRRRHWTGSVWLTKKGRESWPGISMENCRRWNMELTIEETQAQVRAWQQLQQPQPLIQQQQQQQSSQRLPSALMPGAVSVNNNYNNHPNKTNMKRSHSSK